MKYNTLYKDMIEQNHLLIAGKTGSGKSKLEENLIFTTLLLKPTSQFYFIDCKRVELSRYRNVIQCMRYADDSTKAVALLDELISVMDQRYKTMQHKRLTLYDGSDIYLYIDEFADLITTNKKAIVPRIQRLAQLGRASKIHIILCTQTPIAKILPTEIKCNFDSRVGLRTRSKQDSRNILDFTGLETLPKHGEGYYLTPDVSDRYKLPLCNNDDLSELLMEYRRKPSLLRMLLGM